MDCKKQARESKPFEREERRQSVDEGTAGRGRTNGRGGQSKKRDRTTSSATSKFVDREKLSLLKNTSTRLGKLSPWVERSSYICRKREREARWKPCTLDARSNASGAQSFSRNSPRRTGTWKEIPRVPAFALSPLYARRDAGSRAFSRTRPRDLRVRNEVGSAILRLSANTERMIIGILECIRN